MLVESILRTKGRRVVTAAADTTVPEIVATLARERIGAVVVAEGERIVGIVSERDLVRVLATQGAELAGLTAADVMTRTVATCTPEDTVEHIMRLMTEGRFRHLPVVQDGTLIGIISIGDVVKQRLAELEDEARSLKAYIAAG